MDERSARIPLFGHAEGNTYRGEVINIMQSQAGQARAQLMSDDLRATVSYQSTLYPHVETLPSHPGKRIVVSFCARVSMVARLWLRSKGYSVYFLQWCLSTCAKIAGLDLTSGRFKLRRERPTMRVDFKAQQNNNKDRANMYL